MNVFPGDQTVLTDDHVRHKMGGAAEVAYTNGLVAEVRYLLNPRLGHQEEDQLILSHHEQLDRNPSYSGGNTLRHGDRIVQITGAKSVHRHG